MSAQEQVAKLEALLARVNGRRGAPRKPASEEAHAEALPASPPEAVAPPAFARSAAPQPAPTPPPTPAPTPKPKPVEAPVATPAPAVVAAVAPTPPPPPVVAARSAPPGADLEVEVEEGLAEVDLEGLDEGDADASLSDSVADLETVAGKDDEADLPASSRRPIQIQPQLEELAFGDAAEAKASHPAPPESRRQVAIPPADDFDDGLKSSGVRPMPEATETPKPAAAVELKADVTRPAAATASAAVFHGALPIAKPATFGELLDATLGL